MPEIASMNADWWKELTPEWKQAFAEVFFRHTNAPTGDELRLLSEAPALRFAGPSAPYPNMSFELPDLSGITQMVNLQTLVVVHHTLQTIPEVSRLKNLRALFVNDNRLTSLAGVEDLLNLEQLYAQNNRITSMAPVQKLVNLKELYINSNEISSLEGLTEEHADTLQVFFCKPNDHVKQKDMLRLEREIGIRCRSI